MQKDVSNKRPRRFEIMNVTSEIVRDYWHEMRVIHDSPNGREGSSASRAGLAEEPDVSMLVGDQPSGSVSSPASATTIPVPSNDTSYALEDEIQGHHENHLEIQDTGFGTQASYHTPGMDHSMFVPPSVPDYGASSNGILLNSQTNAESAAAHLPALRETHIELPAMVNRPQQIPNTHAMRPNVTRGVPMLAPNFDEEMFDDGIFLPGSTYQELHTTLRNHVFNTARSNPATRFETPEHGLENECTAEQDSDQSIDFTTTATIERHESDHVEAIPHKAPELTQHREYELWKNYIDEVAPWLDKFDNQCHFGHKLPPLAKSHPHLRYSILALSARQLERKDHSRPSSASLALYQEAIHQLLPELQTRNTAVIASCVVLCVLEMMSCSPKEWRRHLDGCASLMESVGINGFVGGIEQALFWCFARMGPLSQMLTYSKSPDSAPDVCGGLITSDRTLIPIGNWASKLSLADDIRLFREASSFDTYANYAVFLCGQVLDLFANYAAEEDIHTASYAKRWSRLFELLEDWYLYRPEEMRSILHLQADKRDYSRPFPILLFGNAPAGELLWPCNVDLG
ncbi:hypothetical protein H2201_009075 [Coniosporium apollinis]|uniref:Transcription factor domain-containing protein n=1 Tax=Coniosporium apollinis TaxID=61459 RepID=A0ABQ9NFA6_9PEZI|nr:hypothetical protein H2201_009075 [Coniosporium apollinis]